MSDLRDSIIKNAQDLPCRRADIERIETAVESAYRGDEYEAYQILQTAIRSQHDAAFYDSRYDARIVLEFIEEIDLAALSAEGREDEAIAKEEER